MLPWHSAGAVSAGHGRHHHRARTPRQRPLPVPRQVLAAHALVAHRILRLLRPRSPIPRLLRPHHQAGVHLVVRVLVALDQFLAVRAARRRPPPSVVHRVVLPQKVMASRVKKATAGRLILTKAVLTSSATIAPAP